MASADELYMKRCLDLAVLGRGWVSPNPMVGAVLVYEDRILAEGFHERYGEKHAEVNCLELVPSGSQDLLPKARLYVSLEPCAHHGKTPPCTDLVISKKINEVIIGCRDENAIVNGRGIEQLRKNGINVKEGVLEKECRKLNERFFYFQKNRKPRVLLKWAQSSDGFLGRMGERVKISNALSDRLVHKWRGEEDAILVGYNTAKNDNPILNTRLYPGKDPLRIVYDAQLTLPHSHFLFDGLQPALILNNIQESRNSQPEYCSMEKWNVEALLQLLGERSVQSLLVEGGRATIQQFIDSGNWNEARIITSAQSLQDGLPAPLLRYAELTEEYRVGTDRIAVYKNLKG